MLYKITPIVTIDKKKYFVHRNLEVTERSVTKKPKIVFVEEKNIDYFELINWDINILDNNIYITDLWYDNFIDKLEFVKIYSNGKIEKIKTGEELGGSNE